MEWAASGSTLFAQSHPFCVVQIPRLAKSARRGAPRVEFTRVKSSELLLRERSVCSSSSNTDCGAFQVVLMFGDYRVQEPRRRPSP